ncbi:type II secretion system protein N [Pseudaestuariivita sp.]|uniref:type II secretion system protein N n=1 Tax=Pseudaestuariivita sp. TaxID=2211669 RepID=UPI00405A2ED0
MTAGRLWALTCAVALIAIASLVLAGAQAWWHLQGHTAAVPRAVPAPSEAAAAPEPWDLAAIARFAPFGEAPSAPPERTTSGSATLNVVLRGVLLDGDPTQSRAFVSAEGVTATYRVGDTVGPAELVAINADTITLRLDDRLRIVGFDGLIDGTEAPAGESASEDAAPEAPSDPFARLAAAIVPGQGSIDLRDVPPPETTEEYIDLWRDRIAQNPQAAMDTVGVELVENGYRVKEDPNIGVTLAGLRPGDVITTLNGQAVGDLARDRELYDEVAAAGIARLEVVRDGKAILLTFPLR